LNVSRARRVNLYVIGTDFSEMETVKTLVLPGLDGTDLLLDGFRESAPSTHHVTVLTLPDDHSVGYRELCEQFSESVHSMRQCTLIGESFSGPLAVLLAHRHPDVVRHLVLVASFATSPMPRAATLVPWAVVFRWPLPTFVARRFLVGPNLELIPTLKHALRIHAARTLAYRMRTIAAVDVTSEVQELTCPITYLRPTHDALVSKRHAQTLLRLNKRVTVRQIEGPHLILQTQPQQAWRHIVETMPAAPSR
jgi:pimeloyl-ACP methyl ester carboxylesterase